MKILLVDDEPLMRVALTSLLDYEAHGFEICGTAANGREALRLIEQEHPEIVITDLKMPVMDGLELIREVQARNLLCKVLVISNYSDYELVREALKLGAVDYLLKINIQESSLLQQLEALRKLIMQDKAYVVVEKKQKQHLTQQQKKNILRDFFCGSEQNIETFIGRTDLSLYFLDSPCNLFYIIPGGSAPDSPSYIDFSTIEKVLEESLRQAELPMEMFTLFPTGMAVLTLAADIYLSEFAWHLQDILQTYISAPCTVIYSNSFVGYTEAKKKFALCKRSSELLFYGSQKLIHAEDVVFQTEHGCSNAFTLASQLSKLGAVEGCEAAQAVLLEALDHCCDNLVLPAVVRSYFSRVFEVISVNAQDESEHVHSVVKKLLEQLALCTNAATLRQSLLAAVEKLYPSAGVRKDVLAILDYVDQNYSQKLTLSDIADHVYLNESYICRIFKEDMNVSIVKYINTVRMEQAARLIESGTIPVKNVCYSVGIETPSYFYRLFKTHFGVSPMQYANGERR